MQANTSDKCYVYFDVYKLPIINNVTTSSTSDSITVNVEAIKGDADIHNYYFSINNGEYFSFTIIIIFLNNLNSSTSYNIKIYATDTNNKTSEIYNIAASTFGNPITFTIGNTEYQAAEGMTWREWVNSSYNTGGYIITTNSMIGEIVGLNANRGLSVSVDEVSKLQVIIYLGFLDSIKRAINQPKCITVL